MRGHDLKPQNVPLIMHTKRILLSLRSRHDFACNIDTLVYISSSATCPSFGA